MSSCQLSLTEKEHTDICVESFFWRAIKKLQYVLPFPWSTHQNFLMAMEIRALCLLACVRQFYIRRKTCLFSTPPNLYVLCIYV